MIRKTARRSFDGGPRQAASSGHVEILEVDNIARPETRFRHVQRKRLEISLCDPGFPGHPALLDDFDSYGSIATSFQLYFVM